jgi:hypothetical protein
MKRYRWMALAALAGLGALSGCANSNNCCNPCNPCQNNGGGLLQRLGLHRNSECACGCPCPVGCPVGCPACPAVAGAPCCEGGMLMSAPGGVQGPPLPLQNGGPFMPGADQLGPPRLEPQAQPQPANPAVRVQR